MSFPGENLSQLIREPKAPRALRKQFRREVTLTNSRNLKAVTPAVFACFAIFMVADYLTIGTINTHRTNTIWNGILFLRPIAMIACGVFMWLFGPLKSVDDITPRHHWLWKVYLLFFMVYTATIVGFMFPLKEAIGPFYIILLGPSAFIAMTTRQTTFLMILGMISISCSLTYFAPGASTVKYHIINVIIISGVSYITAHVRYASTFHAFMNRHIIEEKNEQLEAAHAKAKAASEAKTDFLAAISHEIRTPMNAILGMTEVTLHTPLSSEQREYIETARESALHLLDVINDILDFSRIEARKLRLISAHFDLPAMIQSAMKTVKLQAEQKGIALDLEVMSDTPRFLKGDPGRLRQVLINLLNNAIKFTDDGYIRVTIGPWTKVEKDVLRPVGLRFSIKDSGTGIEGEKLTHIFEAFTQADGSASRSYGGSGLGLSICKNLVDLMGGEISAQSKPGAGSEFIFTARFAEGDPERATESDMMAASVNVHLPIKPSRVLLVDDNPLNIKVEKLHLDRMKMDTVIAQSGTEALMLLAEQDFDIVLMDLEMPGMDGHETTRRIRSGTGAGKAVRQPAIPILAVTAHALADVREQCERNGMDGFVAKPVGFGELGSAMRQILGGDWRTPSPHKTQQQTGPPVLDLVQASTHLGVSQTEIRHLVPNAMTEITLKLGLAEKAVRTTTLREVALQTHTLKSVAASIGAEATRRAAVKLENASRRDDIALTHERIAQLRDEVARLEKAVNAI